MEFKQLPVEKTVNIRSSGRIDVEIVEVAEIDKQIHKGLPTKFHIHPDDERYDDMLADLTSQIAGPLAAQQEAIIQEKEAAIEKETKEKAEEIKQREAKEDHCAELEKTLKDQADIIEKASNDMAVLVAERDALIKERDALKQLLAQEQAAKAALIQAAQNPIRKPVASKETEEPEESASDKK